MDFNIYMPSFLINVKLTHQANRYTIEEFEDVQGLSHVCFSCKF